MTDTPPEVAATSLETAKKALTKGQFLQALTLCEALANQPLSAIQRIDADYIKAVACRYLKRFDEAHSALTTLLSHTPNYARAYQERGHLYLAEQKSDKAAKAFYDATLSNPALVGSWRAMVTLYQSSSGKEALQHAQDNFQYWSTLPQAVLGAADMLFSGNVDRADQICRQFLQQNKHHIEGLYVLALIDIQVKAYDEAEFLLESCCELAPKHLRAKAEYAALLNRIGKFQLALTHAQVLLDDDPAQLSYQVLKGVALVGLGQVQEGLAVFNAVLIQEPQRASLWLQLGHAQKSLGKLDEAVYSYKQALAHRASYGDAYWSLANTKAYRFTPDELTQMEALANDPKTLSEDSIHITFALGKGYEDSGEVERAFHHYEQGNREQFTQSGYQPDLFSQQVDKHIAFFTSALFEQHSQCGFDDPSPIFIVGLPRAGSTLLEQILSSHTKVDATQELHNILSLAKRLRKQGQYPDILSQLDSTYFARFGQQYLEQTQAYRQGGIYFIDKMPNNFLHVGLVKLILPNAKVIDARREPLDCCYSCFKQLFAEGQDFTYDLEAVGQYYKDYQRIMAHWDKVLPNFVLRVNHEDVLDNLNNQVKRILDFCQLDFEPACLTFYENQRAVQTPSAAQVRRPINKDGVGKWKAIEHLLEPLKRILT